MFSLVFTYVCDGAHTRGYPPAPEAVELKLVGSANVGKRFEEAGWTQEARTVYDIQHYCADCTKKRADARDAATKTPQEYPPLKGVSNNNSRNQF